MYGLSVVPLPRLDQDHTSCRTLAPLPAAEEVLDASMGHAHQPLVVMVHVVSMAMELGRYGFDTAVPVAHKMHEILMDVRGIPPDPRLLKSRESSAVVVQCGSTTPSEYYVDQYRVETLTHSLQCVPQPRPKLAVLSQLWN
jgi:hypothetical protein